MRARRERPSRLALGTFGRDGENFRRRPKPVAKRERDPKKTSALKVRLVAAAMGIGACLVIGRAWHLQISSGTVYDDVAQRQALTSARITAKRGVIKDRNGAELALSVDVDSIFAEPARVEEPRKTAQTLAPILGIKAEKLEKKLRAKRSFVFLRRRVSAEVGDKVRALKLPGIGSQPEPQRFYANRELASHILGFTDADGHGKAGVEKTFDDLLRGKSYEMPGLRDALGRKAFVEGFVPQAVLEGDDVILTIDRHIQHTAQVELERTIQDSGAASGVALVMRPQDGEILALASAPSFNPNNLSGSSAQQHLNRAVSAVFEPGSTLKMVTIAAALEENMIEPASKLNCENGQWKVGGRTIRDSEHRYGVLTIPEIMKFSSNICSAKIGFLLGREKLHAWLTRFGFGQPTGVELPGELNGLLRPGNTWREIELANVAFGQGLSVTPLQVAQAAAVIANGGVIVEPHLLKATADKAGKTTPYGAKAPRRVISGKTASELTKMMIEVTQKGGTAELAAIPGFTVAGKTGTAQKIDPVTKAYSRALYVASFVGFVPADRPEVLVLVLIDEPKRSIYGGQVAAPAFRAIATAALSALSIFPEDAAAKDAFLASHKPAALPEQAKPEETIDAAGNALDGALSTKARAMLRAGAASEETPAEPAAEPIALDAEAAPEPRAGGKAKMPNFAGLRVHEVLNRSAEVHCDLVLLGTGRVVRQSPRAGAALEPGSRCELVLSPNG